MQFMFLKYLTHKRTATPHVTGIVYNKNNTEVIISIHYNLYYSEIHFLRFK